MKEKMNEVKVKAEIEIGKAKNSIFAKRKDGLSHFVEILLAILVAIVVGGVFMTLANDGMETVFSNMINRIINGFN